MVASSFKVVSLNRFLSPSGNSSFYGQGRSRPPVPRPDLYPPAGLSSNDGTYNTLLQSISSGLNAVQSQLSTIQQQNLQRDETMKKVLQEIDSLKEKLPIPSADNTTKSKRCRKSPRGLSVSAVYYVSAILYSDLYFDDLSIVLDLYF